MHNNPICCLQSYPFVVKVIQEEGRHQIQVGGVSSCGENWLRQVKLLLVSLMSFTSPQWRPSTQSWFLCCLPSLSIFVRSSGDDICTFNSISTLVNPGWDSLFPCWMLRRVFSLGLPASVLRSSRLFSLWLVISDHSVYKSFYSYLILLSLKVITCNDLETCVFPLFDCVPG